MREAFLKYIAANGNIVGQALRLPTMIRQAVRLPYSLRVVSKSRSEFFGRSN